MKRRTDQPVFGETGAKLIKYLGELPGIFGPFVTKKIYRFRLGKNPRAVDVRDLTLLAKAAGRDNLQEYTESGRPKRRRVKEKETRPVEPAEEVDNDTESDASG